MTSFLRLAYCAGALLLAAACADAPSQLAKPGRIASLQVISGDSQSGPPLTELPAALTVRAMDANGVPVPGQIINFRVTKGGGSVFAGANVTNADGIARERWTLGQYVGTEQKLEARAVDNETGQGIVFGTFTATVGPGAPADVRMYREGSGPALAGSSVPDSIMVDVWDAQRNRVPNQQVTWTVMSGGGVLGNGQSTATSTTNAQGVATIRWWLGRTAGRNSLRVTAGAALDSIAIVGQPGSPVRLVIEPQSLQLAGVNATGKLKAWGVTTQAPQQQGMRGAPENTLRSASSGGKRCLRMVEM